MGKSDPYVFNFYARDLVDYRDCEDAAYFGQPSHNPISKFIDAKNSYFYDLSITNWEINSSPYEVNSKFDLIVCTRCAYFSKFPIVMINQFAAMLKKGGVLFIDWGLGDHWRFEQYKVGWLKNNEHEYAYTNDNYLWSTVWDDSFLENKEVKRFEKSIENHGYHDLKNDIIEEVPVIMGLNNLCADDLSITNKSFLTLWGNENPQLYIALTFTKEA